MYRARTIVIMRGMGRVSRRQSLAMLGSPSQQSQLGGTGARGSFYADLLGSSYARGLAPCHSALQQEVNKGLHLCALVVYLSKEGEQGAPYSSPTIHIVLPLVCMGLGNVESKHRLICL
jgi:hypothetical protein